MTNSTQKADEWQPCEAGFLVERSQQAKSTRRRLSALRAGAGAALLICALGLGVWSTGVWSAPGENYFGGIACHEVQENGPAFLAGTLADELRARIEAHLQQCPVCRDAVAKMRAAQAAGTSHGFWACDCPDCQQGPAYIAFPTRLAAVPGTLIATASSPRRNSH